MLSLLTGFCSGETRFDLPQTLTLSVAQKFSIIATVFDTDQRSEPATPNIADARFADELAANKSAEFVCW